MRVPVRFPEELASPIVDLHVRIHTIVGEPPISLDVKPAIIVRSISFQFCTWVAVS